MATAGPVQAAVAFYGAGLMNQAPAFFKVT